MIENIIMYFYRIKTNILEADKSDISAIILGAGHSRRFGYPKASLDFDPERNFLQQLIHVFSEYRCGQIVGVINRDVEEIYKKNTVIFPENVTLAVNPFPEKGRLFSLKTGLDQLNNAESVFIANVDNPFLDSFILDELTRNREKADCIVPVFSGRGGHPVLISKRIVNAVLRSKNEDIKLSEFLQNFGCFRLETAEDRILININTQEDYQRYFDKF